ncbi:MULTISPECIES: hypothetical protein, partial [unclassified Bilifractor]|uniref:hypothetical protein n=1 Tax=unclassified Bilifractor TaxID=2815795 RepID=UPI003F93007A
RIAFDILPHKSTFRLDRGFLRFFNGAWPHNLLGYTVKRATNCISISALIWVKSSEKKKHLLKKENIF